MIAFFAESASTLLANRLRTFLTAIGLVVGVAAIVAIQVAAAGMTGAVDGILKGMNADTFIVFPKGTDAVSSRSGFHRSDLALVETVPGVQTAIPYSQTRTMVDEGHHRVRLKFGGDSDQRFSTAPLAAGRSLDAQDIEQAASVCVISDNAYRRLFPEAAGAGNLLGRSVYVGPKRYVIVGVLGKTKIDTAALGIDLSNDVAIPYTTYYNNYQRGSAFFGIQVLGAHGFDLKNVESQVQALLASTHQGADYQIFDFAFLLKSISGFFSTVGVLVSAIGAISLLVAGIGIMNIMLVSVAERTREIGIRKAIGARIWQILAQFFIEALLISAFGCFTGMLLGLAFGGAANSLFISRISGVTASIPFAQAILIAVGFSTFVALVFGTYPAYRAAHLDPIQALRYE